MQVRSVIQPCWDFRSMETFQRSGTLEKALGKWWGGPPFSAEKYPKQSISRKILGPKMGPLPQFRWEHNQFLLLCCFVPSGAQTLWHRCRSCGKVTTVYNRWISYFHRPFSRAISNYQRVNHEDPFSWFWMARNCACLCDDMNGGWFCCLLQRFQATLMLRMGMA